VGVLVRNQNPSVRTDAARSWSWRSIVLFLITIVLILLSLGIAAPFLPALTWSVALAVSVQRPYRWLLHKTGKPTLAAALGTALVMLLIVGPVLLLLERLVAQFLQVVPIFTSGAAQDWLQSTLQTHPKLNSMLSQATAGVDLKDSARSAAAFVAGKLQGILAGSVNTLTQMAIMLYALFFFLLDGRQIAEALGSILPMTSGESSNLLHRMQSAVEASILGSLTIAAIQGTVGGIIFALLGVPNAILWGFMMGVLATVPSLGTFLVWAPVAVFLLLSGHEVKAAILAACGMFLIGSIDNVLYPSLVSRRLEMHTLAAFFGVLGGVAIFGISGLVLGPLILVTATELIRIWQPGAFRVPTTESSS
jgi:predicted PurR-regulated permease PerM